MKFKLSKMIFILMSIVMFTSIVSSFYIKSKMQEILILNEIKVKKLRSEIIKDQWILKTCMLIKNKNRLMSDKEVYEIANRVYDQAEFYKMPQAKDYFISCVSVESNFNNNCVGSNGERTFVQFMKNTYLYLTGDELTEHKIKDELHIIDTWFKLIALYTFTYYDNEKVFIAYNCGSKIFQAYNYNLEKIKKHVYFKKNRPVYSDVIQNKYIEFCNYLVK